MNCKQGDRAFVVRDTTGNPATFHLIGTPIECETLVQTIWGPGWLIKGQPLRCPCCAGPVYGFFDADLQPIRPGPEKTEACDSRDVLDGVVA